MRSGAKYSVYWDVFRDFLVEGQVPKLGESFLLRQYPKPCITTFEFLCRNAPCTIDVIREGVRQSKVGEGTALNWVRELRQLGVVVKVGEAFQLRDGMHTLADFERYIRERLQSHVVVATLRQSSSDTITQQDVLQALKARFRAYEFEDKTWATYANYFTSWLKYFGIDLGRRLADISGRGFRTAGAEAFTPQNRPERDTQVLLSFLMTPEQPRAKALEKSLYDLKCFGLVAYNGGSVYLTRRGSNLLKMPEWQNEFVSIAMAMHKIRSAAEAQARCSMDPSLTFEDAMGATLSSIASVAYRKVTASILKAWARFIESELASPPPAATPPSRRRAVVATKRKMAPAKQTGRRKTSGKERGRGR